MDLRAELRGRFGLDGVEYRVDLDKSQLFREALAHDRGRIDKNGPDDAPKAYATALGEQGPLVYYSDPTCTGRPVQDTFAVAWPEVADTIWWKKDLKPLEPSRFEPLLARVVQHLNARQAALYVQNVYCGWHPAYAIPYRFIGEYASHALFAHTMFPKVIAGVDDQEAKRWTMLNVPSFRCQPDRDGTLSERAVITDFKHRIILVLGRADYCGVVKKSLFAVMCYLLPERGELPMHCSANMGTEEDSAVLFGLSGTGKTTLSADPNRQLIGDDEHAWTDEGVSNFEDGCYAKLIDLDKAAEPVIAQALSMPFTLIENVPPLEGQPLAATDPQALDLGDRSITENTRFAYPLSCNPNIAPGARGPHPQTIVLLTADAFGVLPPVSILDEEQVMYHFVSGYTCKLAGTEVGVKEPQAAFSPCFGAPFMLRQPAVYARLLADKMRHHRARCVLLNTGWYGGPFGTGRRMPIKHTRAMLDAALAGQLHGGRVDYAIHPVFKLRMPLSCPGVPAELLDPRRSWQDPEAYDRQAEKVRQMFHDNFVQHDFAALGIKPIM